MRLFLPPVCVQNVTLGQSCSGPPCTNLTSPFNWQRNVNVLEMRQIFHGELRAWTESRKACSSWSWGGGGSEGHSSGPWRWRCLQAAHQGWTDDAAHSCLIHFLRFHGKSKGYSSESVIQSLWSICAGASSAKVCFSSSSHPFFTKHTKLNQTKVLCDGNTQPYLTHRLF